MTESRIGENLVLWDVVFSNDAYKDQMGISQKGYIVINEYLVKIVEEREVPYAWSKGFANGYRAITEDGQEFFCNWERFPDDSMTPMFYWSAMRDGEQYFSVQDALQSVNLPISPYVIKNGNKAIPYGALHCNKHNNYFLLEEKCWRCEYEHTKRNK